MQVLFTHSKRAFSITTRKAPLRLSTALLLFASSCIRTMSAWGPKNTAAAKDRLVYGSDDVLFGHIEKLQGNKPFGSVLDAGTGLHSLRWLATLGESSETDHQGQCTMTEFTAVTADESMRRNVQNEVDALGISHLGKVVIGNWFPPDYDDEQSLASIDKDAEGNTILYDTILADYLIGAMAGFPPGHFSQDLMIEKLAQRLKPGGRLYIVGLQPIPDSYHPPNAPQNIICKVRQVRDACILLAGDRCYREYPLDWIERQVNRLTTGKIRKGNSEGSNQIALLKLVDTKKFPILYRHTTIVKQINVARHKLQRFPSMGLAKEMKAVLNDLEKQSYDATEGIAPGKRIELGFDYVVTAERVDE